MNAHLGCMFIHYFMLTFAHKRFILLGFKVQVYVKRRLFWTRLLIYVLIPAQNEISYIIINRSYQTSDISQQWMKNLMSSDGTRD